jgi:hypothetical protein
MKKKFLFLFLFLFLFSIQGYCTDPVYTIIGPTGVLAGQVDVYTVNPADAISYNWTVTGGVIVSGQGTPSIIVDWTDPGTDANVELQMNTLSGLVIIDEIAH